MKSMIKSWMEYMAALLVLATLLCAGLQATMAEEIMLTMSIGDRAGIWTDPQLDATNWPDIGGRQEYQYYTHYSPLITLSSDGKIIPWMAESYEFSEDHKTLTFNLRKGVKFADGTPLNASILKFNFDRLITFGWKDWATKVKQDLFVYYDYSEASDEYTFKIHYTKGLLDIPLTLACAHMLAMFISPYDVNPAWDIRGMLKPEKKYNGLGPYYVDENNSIPKQKVVLIRRHSWRDDLDFNKPMLEKIVLKLIKDPQTAVMALEKGDIDYVCRNWNVPMDALPKLENNTDITIKTSPSTRMFLLRTAYWKEPFNGTDGILLRKAICYALNRTEMVIGAFNGYAVPATDSMFLSPHSPEMPKCCDKGYDYDLNKAKQFLAEAGWNDTDGDGILDKEGTALKNLDLVITSASNLAWQKDLALVVQSQLKKIGIDVQIKTVEYSEYVQIQKNGKYDLLMKYTFGHPHVNGELDAFCSANTEFGNYYVDKKGLLKTSAETARNTNSKEEHDKCICQICNILYEEAGVIPLVNQMQYAVMDRSVNSFEFGPAENYYYMDHVEECRREQ
jgi:peptide/nickel transport system substrate-binding protein